MREFTFLPSQYFYYHVYVIIILQRMIFPPIFTTDLTYKIRVRPTIPKIVLGKKPFYSLRSQNTILKIKIKINVRYANACERVLSLMRGYNIIVITPGITLIRTRFKKERQRVLRVNTRRIKHGYCVSVLK